MTWICEGCETTYTGTTEEAYSLGWDMPEVGMQHITCPTCAINKTVWWKIAVENQEPTEKEIKLLNGYMQRMLVSGKTLPEMFTPLNAKSENKE